MDTIKIISSYLKEEFELDAEDVQEMLEEFVLNLEEIYDSCISLIKEKDFLELKKQGHSLKGGARNLGAKELGEIGFQIEEFSKDENAEEIEKLLESIKERIAILK